MFHENCVSVSIVVEMDFKNCIMYYYFRPIDEANMQVTDKDINVYAESCLSEICEENCLKAVNTLL